MQSWNWSIARTWLPVNLIFVGMLWSSFPALQLLGVGMVRLNCIAKCGLYEHHHTLTTIAAATGITPSLALAAGDSAKKSHKFIRDCW
jgi:hypothetical protein